VEKAVPIGNDQANETTTNLLVNAMLTFIEHPAAWERLRANRELVPSAIEEVLRYRSPVQSMFRVAKRDVHVGGETLPEGGWGVAWIGSANHDEEQFPLGSCVEAFRESRTGA
jgi:cytochrome P450